MKLRLDPTVDRELLRALRGKRAQSQLSKHLGYNFNQVYLWETGRRVIHWKDLENYCKALNRPLTKHLQNFFSIKQAASIAEILSISLRGRKKRDVAIELGVSPSKLSRWLSGFSDPPLREALLILEQVHLGFHEFLDVLAGEGRITSIQPRVRRDRALKEALLRFPFSGAVAPALGLASYQSLEKHQPGFLARKLGISLEEEEMALQALLSMDQVEIVEGKYRLKPYRVNLVQNKQRFLEICQYWSDRAARLPKRVGGKSLFGYRVFGASEQGFAQLRQAQIDYYHALSAIIKNENGPFDHVIVVNLHTFLLEET